MSGSTDIPTITLARMLSTEIYGCFQQHAALDLVHRDIRILPTPAVVGAGAVVAHEEHAALRHQEAGAALGDALPGQVRLIQHLAVDIGIPVLEGDLVPGQAHHALDQQLAQLIAPEGDDVPPLGRGVRHHIRQLPRDQQRVLGNGGLHGAGGHPAQLEDHLEQHHDDRHGDDQISPVVPEAAPGLRGQTLAPHGALFMFLHGDAPPFAPPLADWNYLL